MDTETVYRFGSFEVDPRRRQVRRAGVAVEPQPKAFDLLVYLIEHRDRVVDKDELLARLWPRMVVSESALTQALRKARGLIGDDGAHQKMIRTVQRRGFRFVAPLEEEKRAQPAPAERPAQGEAGEASVAVLPFVDMSPEGDQQYFCDGMSEEIINELTKTRGLRVAARTSAFAYKHRQDDVRTIGRELGVTSVLEGSVRKAGDRLRVTAQLVDASTGFHLWSERWDRKLEDLFAIQDEIARRIAAALRQPATQVNAATVVGAQDFYERGLAYLHRFGVRSQRFAMDLFRQALAIDPDFASAWAGMALSHVLSYRRTEADRHHLDEALAAVDKALGIDPACAQAHAARGAALALRGDLAAAEEAFAQALEHGPDVFESYYCYAGACMEFGRYEHSAQLYERAAELRPDDYQAWAFVAQAHRSIGRTAQERNAAAKALAAADGALARDPTDARALSLSVCSLITLGRPAEARARLERTCALEPDEPYVHYNAACAYARMGDTEAALDALERIDSTLCRRTWVDRDTDLDSVRHHPRFQALRAALD